MPSSEKSVATRTRSSVGTDIGGLLFERRNNRDAHIAVTQNRPRDRAKSQSTPSVAAMSSDDDQIDLLALGDLEQGSPPDVPSLARP